MADYIIRKKSGFTFALEGNEEKVYTIPPFRDFGFDDLEALNAVQSKGIAEQGKFYKDFLLKIHPELADEKIGDVEYFSIMEAYFKSQNDTGES